MKPTKHVKFINNTTQNISVSSQRHRENRERKLHQSYDKPDSIVTDWNDNTQI